MLSFSAALPAAASDMGVDWNAITEQLNGLIEKKQEYQAEGTGEMDPWAQDEGQTGGQGWQAENPEPQVMTEAEPQVMTEAEPADTWQPEDGGSEAPFTGYRQACADYLDQEGIFYDLYGENKMEISYTRSNGNFGVTIVFYEEDRNVYLFSADLGSFQEDQVDKAIALCNDLNTQYRWVKFYRDADNSIIYCEADAMVTPETVGPVVLNLVQRMTNIMDEAYPTVMKTRWG